MYSSNAALGELMSALFSSGRLDATSSVIMGLGDGTSRSVDASGGEWHSTCRGAVQLPLSGVVTVSHIHLYVPQLRSLMMMTMGPVWQVVAVEQVMTVVIHGHRATPKWKRATPRVAAVAQQLGHQIAAPHTVWEGRHRVTLRRLVAPQPALRPAAMVVKAVKPEARVRRVLQRRLAVRLVVRLALKAKARARARLVVTVKVARQRQRGTAPPAPTSTQLTTRAATCAVLASQAAHNVLCACTLCKQPCCWATCRAMVCSRGIA